MLPIPPVTNEQRAILERTATLSRRRFAPRAARYDAESSFPYENYRDLHEAGLLALSVPREYGGLGADPITYAHALRHIAKGCPATGLTFNMHSTVISLLAALASEEQKRRWFADVVQRGARLASITSEPEQSFRDKFVFQTVFRRVEDGWRVSGVKQFCSLGDAADWFLVSGVVEGSSSARDGVLSAMVPRNDRGVKIEGTWNAGSMRGTISHTIRYDCIVSDADVVGTPGALFDVDLSGYALGYASVYLGIAEAAFEFMVEHASTKAQKPSTEPMSHHPLVQRTLGEVSIAVRTALLLLHEAARIRATGDKEATMLAVNQAKTCATDVAMDVTELALRLAGGRGILKEMPVERWHRDALAGPVMPPSNDRCLETIGKLLCGLRATTLEFE